MLKTVTSFILEPMTIEQNVFSNIARPSTLYVPKGTKEKYQAIYNWVKNFSSVVEIDIHEQQSKGDVNGDMTVDVADIASVIDVMAAGTNNASADVNGDGTVDVADIAAIIDEMAASARRQGAEE